MPDEMVELVVAIKLRADAVLQSLELVEEALQDQTWR